VPKDNFLNPFDELATKISSAVYELNPVPPEVPGNAVDNDNVFATIATFTVELAVIATVVALVVKAPEARYAVRVAILKVASETSTTLLPDNSCVRL
jgi:hypothetical protein